MTATELKFKTEKIKLTDRKLKSLKPKEKYYRLRTDYPGLTLRVAPTKNIIFRYRYQLHGLSREISIGSYPAMPLKDLLLEYSQSKNSVQNGRDPLEEKRKAECDPANKTVSELSVDFLEDCKNTPKKGGGKRSPRTIKEYERIVDKYILKKWPGVPDFKKMKVSDLNKHNIKKLVNYISNTMPNTRKGKGIKGAKNQANRVLEVLSGMCRVAIENGYMEQNPTFLIPKNKENVRDRFLTAGEFNEKDDSYTVNEIKLVYEVLEESGSRLFRDAFLLALFTGQRVNQIATLRLEYIKEKWIVFPAKVMKSSKDHEIYLTPQVKQIIDRRRTDGLTTDFVFPGIKLGTHVHVDSLKTALRRLLPKFQAAGVPHFSFHDLRRTLATHLDRLGYGSVVGDILSHAKVGVTARHYNKNKPFQVIKAALTVYNETIERAFVEQQATVIAINSGR